MRSEPSGSVPFSAKSLGLNRMSVGIDQDFTTPDMVRLADQPVLFHPLDQPRGAVIADSKLALEIGGRGLLALGDDLDRLAIELGLGVILASRLAIEQIA